MRITNNDNPFICYYDWTNIFSAQVSIIPAKVEQLSFSCSLLKVLQDCFQSVIVVIKKDRRTDGERKRSPFPDHDDGKPWRGNPSQVKLNEHTHSKQTNWTLPHRIVGTVTTIPHLNKCLPVVWWWCPLIMLHKIVPKQHIGVLGSCRPSASWHTKTVTKPSFLMTGLSQWNRKLPPSHDESRTVGCRNQESVPDLYLTSVFTFLSSLFSRPGGFIRIK